ncbi:MAG: ankyrin repeat domain-containing protein [Anaerolineae bacterium]|nr:ankyrin repeat domain-containing protein [Anaerolineae bacterium]
MAQELAQEMIDEFVVAAHHDLPRVQQMLTDDPGLLNENAQWIETPVQAAAHVGNRPIAEFLLAQGAPLDICTAAMLGRADDVRALLADDPERAHATGAHNIPVLYYPAISGSTDIAQILLDAGADVNAGEGGNTALHGAAIFGRTAMVRWLLDHDANPYAEDYEGKTALDRAEANHHDEAAALLKPYFETSDGT